MIDLINVSKRYGATEVLRGINLKVGEGEFIVIRGKSGAGKTTLLKIIGLLESPDNGKLMIFGRDAEELSDDEKSKIRLHRIGFIFQFFNLIPSLTILENIVLPLALAGVGKHERERRAYELLNYLGLAHLAHRSPETLSGGERQRIAILRALINSPKIILADEPTSSLDEENSKMVLELLKKINREKGTAIIMTTTDFYENVSANRDYVLKDGFLHEYSRAK